ncbi:ClpXP protease specificity-enhancing factor SspB [Roseomonas sp. OT10]|uniref:SspB family protein n=1 Tax=Roseomonas cutis TaxID=2897332 RepID=UPI001E34E759|nr:ClpXP protease specificity-enhancing factor SspB [Roseomonas sp. OT10]UFN50542.1 ClpXP protease specificity-enhancing factor SspB [Roseomonas sp. OT10]
MSEEPPLADSLLPYDRWTEDAMREVALRALEHAAAHGLPGEHHFYLTFRTDMPGVTVPGHLKARYPQEMTVVLQHQFWDLRVDRALKHVTVGLSFGGTPSTLVIPFEAIVAFLDPAVRLGLRFGAPAPEAEPEPEGATAPLLPPTEEAEQKPPAAGQVVNLDAFRRRPGNSRAD